MGISGGTAATLSTVRFFIGLLGGDVTPNVHKGASNRKLPQRQLKETDAPSSDREKIARL